MGALLSDTDIRNALDKEIFIEPLIEEMIRPSSIKLRLGHSFKVMKSSDPIDTRASDSSLWFDEVKLEDDEKFIIQPKSFVLASTYEKFGFSKSLVGILNTDSDVARIGLTTHGSSGMVPAGFGDTKKKHVTFELFNFGAAPIILYVGMPICHISFIRTESPSETGHDAVASHGGTPGETNNFGR